MEKTNKFGAVITNDYNEYENLEKKHDIDLNEIIQIDLNRCGVYLRDGEVKENFRVRFKGRILDDYETWYALPVRNEKDTPFMVCKDGIYFYDRKIGEASGLTLDTCESSYQRGPNLLNLNSRSRSNCGGCKACVHNYHKLYDSTVIKDHNQLKTREDIENFLDLKKLDVASLAQIAVVTGLFKGEQEIVDHMSLISDVTKKRGFEGELMYFGCQVNSDEALKALADLGNFYLIYALDNFSKREMLLAKTKSLITLEKAKDTLLRAKENGIKTSISYISGIDTLDYVTDGFSYLKDSMTSFPVINVYQIQTNEQAKILAEEARYLEYYLKSRKEVEKIFKDTEYRPKRWENYRPLWYKSFDNEILPDNSFGQLEKVKTKRI